MTKSEKIYQYETVKIKKYRAKLSALLDQLSPTNEQKEEIVKLFEWNGNARAIKSKAYQEMKNIF